MSPSFLSEQLLFHGLISGLILVLFWILSRQAHLKASLGFLYLFSLPAKLFFFYYFFPELFEQDRFLSGEEKLFILGPMGFFILLEIIGMAKLLREKPGS